MPQVDLLLVVGLGHDLGVSSGWCPLVRSRAEIGRRGADKSGEHAVERRHTERRKGDRETETETERESKRERERERKRERERERKRKREREKERNRGGEREASPSN